MVKKKKKLKMFRGLIVGVVVVAAVVFSGEIFLPSFPVPNTDGAFLITGCSSGIGLSSALDLARRGFTVYAGVRKEADVKALKDYNLANLVPIILDVTSEKDINATVEFLSSTGRPLYGLVNNGGIGERWPFEYLSSRQRRQMIEVNLIGAMELTAAVLPFLKKNAGSRVVNIGSTSGERSPAMMSVYAATKFALRGWSEGLRRQLKNVGVHVSVIEPGFIATRLASSVTTMPNRAAEAHEYSRYFDPKYAQDSKPQFQALVESTNVTDDAIRHALLSPKPRTRYVLTKLRFVIYLAWILPDWAMDHVQALLESPK